jgi:hypothetical protein
MRKDEFKGSWRLVSLLERTDLSQTIWAGIILATLGL